MYSRKVFKYEKDDRNCTASGTIPITVRYNFDETRFPRVKVFFLKAPTHNSLYQVLHTWQQIQSPFLIDFSKSTNIFISLEALEIFHDGQYFLPSLRCWFDGSWVSCLCCGCVFCIALLSLSRILARWYQCPTRHLCLRGHVDNVIVLKQASHRFWHIFIRTQCFPFSLEQALSLERLLPVSVLNSEAPRWPLVPVLCSSVPGGTMYYFQWHYRPAQFHAVETEYSEHTFHQERLFARALFLDTRNL
jgi:hypothetical protein